MSAGLRKIWEDKGLLISLLIGWTSLNRQRLKRNISIGVRVKVIGSVLIDVRKEAMLKIESGVLLRSRNRGYHGHLVSKVKLMVDPGGSLQIGSDTRIYGSCIHASGSMIIGSRCLIASSVQVMDRNGHDLNWINPEDRINTYGSVKPVEIHDDVWIGTNSVILPGTIVGRGSVIMANSVVKGVYPEKCLIGGVPASILKKFED